jgi:oligoribonuclease (3'-5' exoribonuclease)
LEHARPKGEGITHRAMDDIRDSVAELKFYRDKVFKSVEETKKK